MTISIGNAPCSWGVEFPNDVRNPPWETVLQECQKAGYAGIELGPIGYMPEDPILLKEKFDQYGLALVGGVVFRPFHDADKWDEVQDAAIRTCKALAANAAQNLVLIDSISPLRAPTAGRPLEALQFDKSDWHKFVERIKSIAKMGYEEYGLIPSIHSHAAGFMDFEAELRRLLDEVDADILKLCIDTGHCLYAGFDPVPFMQEHIERIAYIHFKDIDPQIHKRVVAERIGFYDACARGVFCNLGQGAVDFQGVKRILEESGYSGWCSVEQDCDPASNTSPLRDAIANREYLQSIGF